MQEGQYHQSSKSIQRVLRQWLPRTNQRLLGSDKVLQAIQGKPQLSVITGPVVRPQHCHYYSLSRLKMSKTSFFYKNTLIWSTPLKSLAMEVNIEYISQIMKTTYLKRNVYVMCRIHCIYNVGKKSGIKSKLLGNSLKWTFFHSHFHKN